jgi:hypothetical protein
MSRIDVEREDAGHHSSQPAGARARTRHSATRVLQVAAAGLVVLLGAIAIFAVVAKRVGAENSVSPADQPIRAE